MTTELIGWVSAAVLIGQIMASVGFVIYSWLLGNGVFVATNVLMLGTALFGQWIYLHNKRRQRMVR
jgi:MtN3 and saliva related transmembrane protein